MFVCRDSWRVEVYYDGIVHVINHVPCLGCVSFVFFFLLKGLKPFKHSVIIRITSSILSANTEEEGKFFFEVLYSLS